MNADEHLRLRETLRTIIRHCGGGTSPTVSSEFLCLAAEEVRLALIAAERRGFEQGRANGRAA